MKQLEEIGRQKKLDIHDFVKAIQRSKLAKGTSGEVKQKKTKKLEHYHYDKVKELEDLYGKKRAQEGDENLKLEQQGLELEQALERRIFDIKAAN